ncbi:hypothetical protein A2U01_0070704, partial [Trifolium medium]|nr:hypothetical protein [Trifolium medium]
MASSKALGTEFGQLLPAAPRAQRCCASRSRPGLRRLCLCQLRLAQGTVC